MIRCFLPAAAFAGERLLLSADVSRYLTRVMRLGAGDRFVALDGLGHAYEAVLESPASAILGPEAPAHEPGVGVRLIQALPKGDKLEWILQKATELGASRLTPLATRHAVVKLDAGKAEGKLARWKAIAQEAAEQCERGRVPEIDAPTTIARLGWAPDAFVGLLAERAAAPALLSALPPVPPPGGVVLLVGPEGGWAPEEVEALVAKGARPVSLGARILRTETAALAALAIVAARYAL